MDIDMPVMDGISAAAAIRDDQLKNPGRARSEVAAYTAGVLPEEALLSHAGIHHVLKKPCSADDVHRCISQCCPTLDSTDHAIL